METPKHSEDNFDYLRESEAKDIKQVIKPIEYAELEGYSGSEEEMAGTIENLSENEVMGKQTEEFVILERKVKSELPGYDFYIARRHRKSKVFEPETVLIAKSKGKHFVQKLDPMQAIKYESLDERGKMLSAGESRLLDEESRKEETASGSHIVVEQSEDKLLGKGGFSKVRPGLRRGKGRFTTEKIALKETHDFIIERVEVSEKEVLSIVKNLRSLNPDAWKYIAEPIDSIESDKHSSVWELVSSKDGENFEVENLRTKIEKKDFSQEEKLVIIRQLFEALFTMSKTGLAHNDIKPLNILLTPEGIKLVDFGLMHFSKKFMDSDLLKKAERNSKLMKKKDKLTEKDSDLPEYFDAVEYSTDRISGTMFYLHPRLMMGRGPKKPGNFNPRYDVYSAVIVAIEILTNGKTGSEAICPTKTLHGMMRFYSYYEYYSEKIKEILREEYKKEMNNPAFAEFINLLEQGLNGGLGRKFKRPQGEATLDEMFEEPDYSIEEKKRMETEKATPIEDLLPTPDAFVKILKKMGVKESF